MRFEVEVVEPLDGRAVVGEAPGTVAAVIGVPGFAVVVGPGLAVVVGAVVDAVVVGGLAVVAVVVVEGGGPTCTVPVMRLW